MEHDIKFTEKKVDDSWKEQISKEKEQASRVSQPGQGQQSRPAAHPMFSEFISSLGMEALIHLGDIDHPVTHRKEANPEAARQTIDLLLMLKEKTKGNLSPEENTLLTDLIADIQLRFVEKSR